MILTLTNKTEYELSDSEAKGVLTAIQEGDKYAVLQGDYIMLSAIVAIQAEERIKLAEHRRNGDIKCAYGQWHGRNDRCYGHDAFELGSKSMKSLSA